jgi:hypothetical protein
MKMDLVYALGLSVVFVSSVAAYTRTSRCAEMIFLYQN